MSTDWIALTFSEPTLAGTNGSWYEAKSLTRWRSSVASEPYGLFQAGSLYSGYASVAFGTGPEAAVSPFRFPSVCDHVQLIPPLNPPLR